MANNRPVAGYYRVSVARDDMKAPQLYQEEIERYCHYRGLRLGEVFSDIDFSAFRGARPRPALEELKGRRREFSAVVVPKLSRFGRSVKDLVTLFDEFEQADVALIFLDIGLDTSTSQGRLLRTIMSAFAEYESDVRADYFRAARDSRAQRGLPNGGWIAFGYRRGKDGYTLYDPEAAIVREVFGQYAGGMTMRGIVRDLNARGIPSPRNLLWQVATIRNFLDNHHYVALLKHDGKLRRGAWPPIVSRGLWEQVQTRRLSIANRGVSAPAQGLYLLSGLVECGVCGATLCHRTKQDRVPGQYVCRGTDNRGSCRGGGIAEHRAEKAVVEAFLERYGASFVYDAGISDSPLPVAVFWGKATLAQRRSMVASGIEGIVLVPRPPDNRRGTGLPRGRSLHIRWSVKRRAEDDGVVLGADTSTELAARVCEGCGHRRHLSNFRLDPSGLAGRARLCSRCRKDAYVIPVDSGEGRPRKLAYMAEWRRFQREYRKIAATADSCRHQRPSSSCASLAAGAEPGRGGRLCDRSQGAGCNQD